MIWCLPVVILAFIWYFLIWCLHLPDSSNTFVVISCFPLPPVAGSHYVSRLVTSLRIPASVSFRLRSPVFITQPHRECERGNQQTSHSHHYQIYTETHTWLTPLSWNMKCGTLSVLLFQCLYTYSPYYTSMIKLLPKKDHTHQPLSYLVLL